MRSNAVESDQIYCSILRKYFIFEHEEIQYVHTGTSPGGEGSTSTLVFVGSGVFRASIWGAQAKSYHKSVNFPITKSIILIVLFLSLFLTMLLKKKKNDQLY